MGVEMNRANLYKFKRVFCTNLVGLVDLFEEIERIIKHNSVRRELLRYLPLGLLTKHLRDGREKKVMKLSRDIKATKIYPGLVGPEMHEKRF
jgi:hypothetical protein